MPQLANAARTRRALSIPPSQPPEPLPGLRAALGAIEDVDHILVIGQDGPELMCALLRAGAIHVTHLRSHERPEAATASLVILPAIASLDWLAAALPAICRALHPNGRVVVSFGGAQSNGQALRHLLVAHGFAVRRSLRVADHHVIAAELPSFALHHRA